MQDVLGILDSFFTLWIQHSIYWDSGFLSVALVEFRIPIVSDAGFRIP